MDAKYGTVLTTAPTVDRSIVGLGAGREPEAAYALGQLQEAVGALAARVEELGQRLEPVMRQGPELLNKAAQEAGRSYASPLAREVGACADRLHATVEKLSGLLARLEV